MPAERRIAVRARVAFAAAGERVDHVLRRPDVGVPAPEVDDLVPLLRRRGRDAGEQPGEVLLGKPLDAVGPRRTATMLVRSRGGFTFSAVTADESRAAAATPPHARNLSRRQRVTPSPRHSPRATCSARGRDGRDPPLRDGDAAGRHLRLQHLHRRRPREPARPPPRRPDPRGGMGGRRPSRRPRRRTTRLRGDRARRGLRGRVPPDRLRRAHALGLGPHAPAAHRRRSPARRRDRRGGHRAQARRRGPCRRAAPAPAHRLPRPADRPSEPGRFQERLEQAIDGRRRAHLPRRPLRRPRRLQAHQRQLRPPGRRRAPRGGRGRPAQRDRAAARSSRATAATSSSSSCPAPRPPTARSTSQAPATPPRPSPAGSAALCASPSSSPASRSS